MPKYKLTNTSAQTKKKRAIFLTEAGRLLKPGEHAVVNRLDKGTELLVNSGALKKEEGDFEKPPIFTPEEEARLAGKKAPSTPEEKAAQEVADAHAAKAQAARNAAKAEVEALAREAADAKAAEISAKDEPAELEPPLAEPVESSRPNDPDMLARAQAAADAKAAKIATSKESPLGPAADAKAAKAKKGRGRRKTTKGES